MDLGSIPELLTALLQNAPDRVDLLGQRSAASLQHFSCGNRKSPHFLPGSGGELWKNIPPF